MDVFLPKRRWPQNLDRRRTPVASPDNAVTLATAHARPAPRGVTISPCFPLAPCCEHVPVARLPATPVVAAINAESAPPLPRVIHSRKDPTSTAKHPTSLGFHEKLNVHRTPPRGPRCLPCNENLLLANPGRETPRAVGK